VEVWLEIDPANQASIRVAEAAGFRRGGMRLESACGGPALMYRRTAG
jgi:RimJ/RimL family protein N-acetyltransferase